MSIDPLDFDDEFRVGTSWEYGHARPLRDATRRAKPAETEADRRSKRNARLRAVAAERARLGLCFLCDEPRAGPAAKWPLCLKHRDAARERARRQRERRRALRDAQPKVSP